jgi:hypothetical protein
MLKILIPSVTGVLVSHSINGKKASIIIESTDSSGSISHTLLDLESDSADILKEIKNGAMV